MIALLQITVSLILFNVWLLRFHRSTPYRGENAQSMSEEFAAYGLPVWFTYVVGVLKVGAAFCLLAGLWFPALVFPAAMVVSILMIGAFVMHLKIRDHFKKSLPALFLLILSVVICCNAQR